jgi:hypothetical protein
MRTHICKDEAIAAGCCNVCENAISAEQDNEETFEVQFGSEWAPGVIGWTCDGWSGETAQEAVSEFLIHNGRDAGEYRRSQIVDRTDYALRTHPQYRGI